MKQRRTFRIRIGRGFSLILICVALFIGVLSLTALHLYSQSLSELLYRESAETLNLHFRRIEDKMREIEALSMRLLSDEAVQSGFWTLSQDRGSYEGYSAERDLRNKLLSDQFSMDLVKSIDTFALDGSTLTAGFRAATHSVEQRAEILRLALDGYGSIRWGVNLSGEGTVSAIRLIRDTRRHTFQPLGILVVDMKMDTLFDYRSILPSDYSPRIVVTADGRIAWSTGAALDDAATLMPLLLSQGAGGRTMNPESDKPWLLTRLSGERVMVVSRTSPYSGWMLTSIVQCDEMFSSMRTLTQVLVSLFAVGTLAAIWTGLRFSRAITRSVESLSRDMKKVESGDFHVVPDLSPGRFEIEETTDLSRDFSIMVGEIDHLINDVYRKELLLREVRINALQSQINPHFLYNTLDMIAWMARSGGSEPIARAVRALSGMFRNAIADEPMITVERELAILQDYLTIQQMRYDDRLVFVCTVPWLLNRLPIPKMTFQPIVENAVKYAIDACEEACTIRLSGEVADGCALFRITDDGPGMAPDQAGRLLTGSEKPKGTGIGLKNIDERLRLTFGDAFGLEIESSPGAGTTVLIRIPDRMEAT